MAGDDAPSGATVITSGASVSIGGLARAWRSLVAGTRTAGPAGPVVAAGLLLVAWLGVQLAQSGGNPTAFILFGHHFLAVTHPPGGALVGSPQGYDGQFFYVQARDPLLLHASTVAAMDSIGRAYQLWRMAYPLLAYGLAAGQPGAIPWTMPAVNVVAILAITGLGASFAREHGRSAWWGLALGVTPGMVLGTTRDLSDPLATAALLGGLILYARRQRLGAALLLSLAVLAREPMIVAVAGVGAETLWQLWRARGRTSGRWAALRAWPVVLLPVVCFAGWQLYTRGLTVPPTPATPGHAVVTHAVARAPVGSDSLSLPPFKDVQVELKRSLAIDTPAMTAWDILYMAVVLGATVTAVATLRRGLEAATIVALLSGLIFGVIFLGDEWGVSRYGAPVIGAAVLGGLRLGLRGPLRWGTAALVLTGLAALVLP